MEQTKTTQKSRKILIFSLVYYPRFIGGAEVAIKEITDRILPSEMEFDMITLRKQAPKFERIGNINVYRVGLPWFGNNTKSSKIFPLSKLTFPIFAFIKALQLHRKNKYDLVWSMMASYAGFAGHLFKIFKPSIPFVLSIQEGDNFKIRQGIFKLFFTKIFSKADIVQVISNFLATWSRNMGAKSPIVVVPNGVNFSLFSNRKSESELNNLKKSLNKKEKDVFIVTTSRLVEKNATIDIIDSLTYLPENVKFLIIGTGYEEEMLKNRVSKLGLENRVHFLGFVKHENMPQYLHISDIFIRPSLSEGFGNSYIEAMAAGIPVIATPVGGILDFLKDNENGLLCEVRNPKNIAWKVEMLLNDNVLKNKIVKNALEMVERKYQWNLIASDMKNKVFLKVI
ncbi:glycosyltransferase family 1 protein [bacterium]|nr:glycosyltransferase family 1 protein [bacterium]